MFEIVREEELERWHLVKEQIIIPERKTKHSAGYDLHIPMDFRISPKEVKLVPTGIKCRFDDLYLPPNKKYNSIYLHLCLKSGFSFKNTIFLTNGVGTIESDYTDNISNDGHILISCYNYGSEEINIKQNQAIAQGIFIPFFTFGELVFNERSGGWGSTDK